MRRRIFSSMVILVLVVEVLSVVTFTILQNRENIRESMNTITSEADYAAAGYQNGGMDYLETLEEKHGDRVTLIAEDGRVLYDSSLDVKKLGDHNSRPEVQEARKKGTGKSDRYSSDMRQETLYYAELLPDGEVLRISTERDSIWQFYLDLRWQVLGMLLFTTAITLWLAAVLARRFDVLEENVEQKTQEADFRREFTANITHELKTPLTSITGYAEMIQNGMVLPDDIPEFAGRISDEAVRMRALVDDVLTLSRMEVGEELYERGNVDLYKLCKQAVSELEPVAANRSVTFRLNGVQCYIEGVEKVLYEMIFNICDNAIRYNKEGGTVLVSVGMRGDRPYISVRDTGIGIPEEDQERVFERFYMVDKSHSRQIGGTGLGLAIVKHGAIEHNAKVELHSVLGEGTEITIVFEKQIK